MHGSYVNFPCSLEKHPTYSCQNVPNRANKMWNLDFTLYSYCLLPSMESGNVTTNVTLTIFLYHLRTLISHTSAHISLVFTFYVDTYSSKNNSNFPYRCTHFVRYLHSMSHVPQMKVHLFGTTFSKKLSWIVVKKAHVLEVAVFCH